MASFGLEFAYPSPHIIDAGGVLSCGMQVLLEHRHLMASPHIPLGSDRSQFVGHIVGFRLPS